MTPEERKEAVAMLRERAAYLAAVAATRARVKRPHDTSVNEWKKWVAQPTIGARLLTLAADELERVAKPDCVLPMSAEWSEDEWPTYNVTFRRGRFAITSHYASESGWTVDEDGVDWPKRFGTAEEAAIAIAEKEASDAE